jgi:hypothetical protein
MAVQTLPTSNAALVEASTTLTIAEKKEALSKVRGHLCLYALDYLNQSGFDFSLLQWGPSIVVQETVFH